MSFENLENTSRCWTRRDVLRLGSATALLSGTRAFSQTIEADDPTRSTDFRLRYLLASCMYGYSDLRQIVPEVRKTGATAIDLWPKVHGNQREQLDEMGEDAFRALLAPHEVRLGCITQYALGPFNLHSEMRLAARLGCTSIVTGARGPAKLHGDDLKAAVRVFVQQMKPHLEIAEQTGVTIAIENHGNSLIDSVDSIKWLAELSSSAHLAIALAPYHLPQDTKVIADLIRQLDDRLHVFYAWQHGMGCMKKLPKAEELLQLPGLGPLDFRPILAALQSIRYRGWTSIFMHPVPRGIPIMETTAQVTAQINQSRQYLTQCLGVE